MTYMPDTEPRCVAQQCDRAKRCARHNCPPGGAHPVKDFSLSASAGGRSSGIWCQGFVTLNHWRPPRSAKPGPTVHDHPGGML